MKLSRSVREAADSATALRAGTTSTTCRSRSSLQKGLRNFLKPSRSMVGCVECT